MSIKIIKPGLFTTVQDKGRFGYQHLGFSSAGAMDRYSYEVGQALINNQGPSLEYTIIGPTLQFNENNTVVLTGGQFNAKLNKRKVPQNTVIFVSQGDQLEIGNAIEGARGYIFFGQPLDIEQVADSYSTHTRSMVGGFKGRPLKKNDVINIIPNDNFKLNLGKSSAYNAVAEDNIIHIIKGPQAQAFSEEKQRTLVKEEYSISDKSDRMGYRLIGDNIAPENSADIISEPVALGSIQVPNDGNPIILLNDKQTVGGYTKIATVSQLDLRKLAQFKPGDTIQFEWISINDANQELLQFSKEFNELLESIASRPTYNIEWLRPTSNKLARIIEEE
ncbi:biotin-dependent carboxyltransferase family protein [Staphylococcus devriesei]|uniref:Allophanate hydrolase n=1 Tax=Staphylococcus devriesei TaxID=586733 RepID=A0A2T4KLZ4_9STAP|nr:biotin-dependent carboxyltransferase family protein [Staphylococcus devriesei]PTE72588.1 allophanate hydrolase [Staphylococcus devriesei]PTF02997.1 allophanate hydrolase [Staphylococcus devriesei]RIL69894.1 biotin-dependent carboxyltransferase family protein [Staphylococcus devriesei]RIL72774.1 biotin-dependent carboxyltransferase family protein [Staphylococcus devriesei]WKU13620.1 biotin-dependent carboxyltransferase family protein [Staphylococcus devriesei]